MTAGVAEGEGFDEGDFTSSSLRTPGLVSVPEYSARRLALVHSGMRTMRGMSTISVSVSWISLLFAEKRYRMMGTLASHGQPFNVFVSMRWIKPARMLTSPSLRRI